jgi:hypothetical protein
LSGLFVVAKTRKFSEPGAELHPLLFQRVATQHETCAGCGRAHPDVAGDTQGYIHSCQEGDWETYLICNVCQVFGVPGEREFGPPARLLVRDILMDKETMVRNCASKLGR